MASASSLSQWLWLWAATLVALSHDPHSFSPSALLLSIVFLQNLSVGDTSPQEKQNSFSLSYLHVTVNSFPSFFTIFFFLLRGFLTSKWILTLMHSRKIKKLFLTSYSKNSSKKLPSCRYTASFINPIGRSWILIQIFKFHNRTCKGSSQLLASVPSLHYQTSRDLLLPPIADFPKKKTESERFVF